MKKRFKKISYILTQYPNLTQTFVSREINALKDLGLEIDVFSLKRVNYSDSNVYYSKKIKIVQANIICFFKNPFKYTSLILNILFGLVLFNFKSVLKNLYIFFESVYFSNLILLCGVKHIHAHFLWGAGTSAWIISRLLKIPFSITVHAFDIFDKSFVDNLFKKKLQNASFIVAISEYNKRLLVEKYNIEKEKIHIIRCGVEKRIFKDVDEQKIENKEPLIVSVGRLTEKKGFKYLLESLKLLNEKGLKFCAEIIGDGEDRELLKMLTKNFNLNDKVVLRGEMSNKEVISAVKQSDLFVLPSIITESGDKDGIPVVLMEAMALGVPVVSTNISGIPELIDNEVNGLLVAEKDSAALAEAIESLIFNKEKLFRIGQNGIKKIQNSFLIEDNAKRLLALFGESKLQRNNRRF